MRARGIAGPRLAGGNVSKYAGLSADARPFPDREMPAYSRLPGENGAIAHRCRPGHTNLRHQQAFLTDAHVVGNVHQVVDLGPAADHSVVDAAAIDGGVGANLDVVTDDTAANVRNLAMRSVAKHVPESVAADAGSRMHDRASSEDRSWINGCAWPQPGTLAD